MADAFSVEIRGLDKLVLDAKKAGQEMQGLLMGTMVKATTMVQEEAKRIGPGSFKNQTGNLRRSIFRRVESAARGVIGVGEKYGDPVEFGSKPHVILPRRGKFLRFKTQGGKVIFTRKVNHPGGKPYPFMEPAAERTRPLIVREYQRVTERVVQVLAGR